MPPAAGSSRKRKTAAALDEPTAPVASTSKSSLPVATMNLEIGNDSDEEDEEENADEGDDQEEGGAFPELDLGSSDDDDDDFADQEDVDDDDEGYNSSDIEAMENEDDDDVDDDKLTSPRSTPPSSLAPSSFSRRSRSLSPVSHFIAENTVKPDEADPSIVVRPEDPRAGKMVISELTGRPKRVYPDIEAGYGSESSTEDAPNRVGDIPDHWYDDLPHIGYDVNGKKIMRPAQGDELDRFLETVEDPDAWYVRASYPRFKRIFVN